MAAFSGVFRPPCVRECVGIEIESEKQGAEGAARMFRGVSERVSESNHDGSNGHAVG